MARAMRWRLCRNGRRSSNFDDHMIIGLSLWLLAVAGRAAAQHSCPPGTTGQLCAACKPGWSRIEGPDGALLNQSDCYKCPDPTNCLRGEPSACAVGSEGQLCAVCSPGWSRIDGLAPNEQCKECGVGSSLVLFVGIVSVFILTPEIKFKKYGKELHFVREFSGDFIMSDQNNKEIRSFVFHFLEYWHCPSGQSIQILSRYFQTTF